MRLIAGIRPSCVAGPGRVLRAPCVPPQLYQRFASSMGKDKIGGMLQRSVLVRSVEAPVAVSTSFQRMGLSSELAAAVASMAISTPTEIQVRPATLRYSYDFLRRVVMRSLHMSTSRTSHSYVAHIEAFCACMLNQGSRPTGRDSVARGQPA
jgi:hypothetical protein